jgi:hypothetical protein
MSSRTGTVRTTRRRLQLADGPPELDHPASLSEGLPRLAAALEEAAEEAGWGNPPSIVRVTAWPDRPIDEGFELAIRPIDDDAGVIETLAGFDAPAEWLALGVVTEGNAHHMDRPDETAPRRVRCVHLVDRAGASASVLRLQGDEQKALEGGEPQGRIDDVCRRALGLATAPPARSSLELWALLWLDRVVAAARATPGTRLQWPAVAALHPAVAVVVDDDGGRGREATQKLQRLAEVLAEVHTWSVLRRSCAEGDWPVDEVPGPIAAWLDDGAFSRWVLGGFPPIALMTRVACSHVAPSAARRLRAALRTWELLE